GHFSVFGFGVSCFPRGGDSRRAFDPTTGGALDIVEYFSAAPAVATDDVAMTATTQIIEVLLRHHAAVADEHHPLEAEALFQIAQHLWHSLGIAPVALKHVMRDRPSVNHN